MLNKGLTWSDLHEERPPRYSMKMVWRGQPGDQLRDPAIMRGRWVLSAGIGSVALEKDR